MRKFAESVLHLSGQSETNLKNHNNMTTFELGNVGSIEQVEKLTAMLSGKTYMNFIVDYSVAAGNYPVTISTERQDTSEEELKSMTLFYMACEI